MSASQYQDDDWVLRIIHPDAVIDGARFNSEIFRPRDEDNGKLSVYLYSKDNHPESALYHWRRNFKSRPAGIAGITYGEATRANSKLRIEPSPTKNNQDHALIDMNPLNPEEQRQAMRTMAKHAEKRRFISVLRPD